MQDDELAAQLNGYCLEHRVDNVELFPDVVDVLDVLSRSYVLGLLSNGNGYPERGGLRGRFAAVVFSQDHGVEKLDRLLFDIAAAEVASGRTRLSWLAIPCETMSVVPRTKAGERYGSTGMDAIALRDTHPMPKSQASSSYETL